ncbi:MAG: hypothetical protein K2J37_06715 [Ruminococcus sp.]|nr:hypothetical protein [Ruminococcus sp.]
MYFYISEPVSIDDAPAFHKIHVQGFTNKSAVHQLLIQALIFNAGKRGKPTADFIGDGHSQC